MVDRFQLLPMRRGTVQERYDKPDAGDIDAVVSALRMRSPNSDAACKRMSDVADNRARMRCTEFRATGLSASTSVVEAGCNHGMGTRCKRAGMDCIVAWVDALRAPRCCRFSGSFEGFWARCARQRLTA